MADIRRELNRRRGRLRLHEDADRATVIECDPKSQVYRMSRANLDELFHIESTLATIQLADAQDRATTAQQEATAEQAKANAAADAKKSEGEEVTFWTRRFMTSMSIANAAGFVAVLSFMFKEDSPAIHTKDVRMALAYFGIGAIMGGLVPVIHLFSIYARAEANRIERRMELRPELRKGFYGFAVKMNGYFYGNRYLTWGYVLSGFSLFAWALLITVGSATGYYEARLKHDSDMARYRVQAPRAAGSEKVVSKAVPAPVTVPVVTAPKQAKGG